MRRILNPHSYPLPREEGNKRGNQQLMQAAGDPELKVYGLFGFPLGHTISPAIHNAAIDYHGLKAFYFAFERSPGRFRFLMRNIKKMLLDGFNVTVPYKEAVIPFLDRVHPAARAIGAVNTVKKEGKKWIGYNTDVDGFLKGLDVTKFNPRKKTAVLIGAGGAARAVCFALGQRGAAKVSIFDTIPGKSGKLAAQYRKIFPAVRWESPAASGKNMKQSLEGTDILVNATPVGLHVKDPSVIKADWLPKRKILVYDLIYSVRHSALRGKMSNGVYWLRETKLLRIAKQLGHQTLNGETMLLHQGARAFEIWTGKRAPVEVMRRALNAELCAD